MLWLWNSLGTEVETQIEVPEYEVSEGSSPSDALLATPATTVATPSPLHAPPPPETPEKAMPQQSVLDVTLYTSYSDFSSSFSCLQHLQVPVPMVTPVLQRELAASKRVSNRRGKGKGKNGKRSKLLRKRSLLRAASAAAWTEVEKAPETSPKKKGRKPKAKAKAACKVNTKAASSKAKAKAGRPRKASKWEAEDWAADDAGEDAENKQRHIKLGGKRWIYEILPNQSLGCAGCRFIFGGCFACQKERFRGQNAQAMMMSEAYQNAVAELDGTGPVTKKAKAKKVKRAAAPDDDE